MRKKTCMICGINVAFPEVLVKTNSINFSLADNLTDSETPAKNNSTPYRKANHENG